MKIIRAYKRTLDLKPHQERFLEEYQQTCRYVWNWGMRLQKDVLDGKIVILNEKTGEPKKLLSHFDYTKQLTTLRKENKAVKQLPVDTGRIVLRYLAKSWELGFSKKPAHVDFGFPKFRKKSKVTGIPFGQSRDTIRIIPGYKLLLPKVGPSVGALKMRKNGQNIEGTIKTASITKGRNRWYVSIQVEQEVEAPIHPFEGREVGVDVGIAKIIALSDGREKELGITDLYKKTKSEILNLESRLNYLKSRRDRRKVKPIKGKQRASNNWKKETKKISVIHEKITNKKIYLLHLISKLLTSEYSLIAVEDLILKDMTKSAKGDEKSPGKNVKSKSGLNRSLLRNSLYELRHQIEYKSSWAGGKVIAVEPKYTSQTCPKCDNISKGNRETQSKFECTNCSYTANADLVAAVNILNRAVCAQ